MNTSKISLTTWSFQSATHKLQNYPGQLVRVADTLAVREIGMGVHTAASVKADDEDLIWWPSIGNFAAMYGWCKRSLICILDS
jgi:hypothetical protein